MRRVLTLILLAVLVVVSLHQWIGFAEIAGHSMYPAFSPRDVVFFYKSDTTKEIKRGDIIIFETPAAWLQESTDDEIVSGLVIKRVVGLPGELISLPVKKQTQKTNILNVDIVTDESTSITDITDPTQFNTIDLMIDGQLVLMTHKVIGELDSIHPQKKSIPIPPDYYYVIGDNLPMSLDSRKYGLLAADSIVGKVFTHWD